MPRLASKMFVEYVRRSGLLDAQSFDAALASYEHESGPLPADAEPLSEFLVKQGRLTNWQAQKLLRGQYKGYFLGNYKLLDQLGTGGMSRVYLAEHSLMRTLRAVKVLPRRRLGESSYFDRFVLEAVATGALDHPHIVRSFDIDNEGDSHYIVMEYVRGPNLKALIVQNGPLDFAWAADYVSQAAHGLSYAHAKDMVHRDIKPANLLLSASSVVKISDFGLARLKESDAPSLTIAYNESVLGTVDYLSPEQAFDSHAVDCRSDIYSLGCTMYFLLTGRPPFSTGTIAQRIIKQKTLMPAPITNFRPSCPASLAAICLKMMQKQPENRYQSAEDVSADLENWLEANEPDYQRANPEAYMLHTASSRPAASSSSKPAPPSTIDGNWPSDPVEAPPIAKSSADPQSKPRPWPELQQALAELSASRTPVKKSAATKGAKRPSVGLTGKRESSEGPPLQLSEALTKAAKAPAQKERKKTRLSKSNHTSRSILGMTAETRRLLFFWLGLTLGMVAFSAAAAFILCCASGH